MQVNAVAKRMRKDVNDKVVCHYAHILKVGDPQITMQTLWEEGDDAKFTTAAKTFLDEWTLVLDKQELDQISESPRWDREGASFNAEYMKTAVKSHVLHYLERARRHAHGTVEASGMVFRTPAKLPLRIFSKPRLSVQAASNVEPWSFYLVPLTTHIKVLKAVEARPNPGALNFLSSDASADEEYKVWLLPQTTTATNGNLLETAFEEPFWCLRRLASNQDLEVKTNCVLRYLTFTDAEICQPDWNVPQKSVGKGLRAKTAAQMRITVPVLTNEAPLAAGEELVWRDDSWTQESGKKQRTAPVLPQPPTKKVKQ